MVFLELRDEISSAVSLWRRSDSTWSTAPWQIKAMSVLPAIWAFLALIAAVLCSIALARAGGRRAPFVALLLAIICTLIYHCAWVAYYVIWFLPDVWQSVTTRKVLLSIAAGAVTFQLWATVLMLVALVLLVSGRRAALAAMLREKMLSGVMRRVFIGVVLSLMLANGLVLGILDGHTTATFWEAKLNNKQIDVRRNVLKALDIVFVVLHASAIIYLAASSGVLRKEMANVGQNDKPTNTVALVILPLAFVYWLYYAIVLVTDYIDLNISDEADNTWGVLSSVMFGLIPLTIFFILSILGLQPTAWSNLHEAKAPEQRGTYVNIDRQSFQQPPVFVDPYAHYDHPRSATSSTVNLTEYRPSSLYSDDIKDSKSYDSSELKVFPASAQHSASPSYSSSH